MAIAVTHYKRLLEKSTDLILSVLLLKEYTHRVFKKIHGIITGMSSSSVDNKNC
jgi:hypothetical protein